MADEQLRLVASLKDNASAGVRNIGKQLKTVRVEPGMQQAQKWVRGFNDDVAQFKKGGLTIANVMSSMGVGGLAAAGSIGALAAQFKQLADHVLDVKELGREIGVTTDQLRAMERAGQHFGFDPAAMEGALKRLAGLMPIFRRGGNNELTQALARSPELIAKIRGEADDTAAVFKDIMGYVGKLTNPQDRIKFYEQIFGNGDLEKLNAEGVGGFEKQIEAARKSLAPLTKEAEQQAQALRDAVIDFNAAVERLELKVAPAVFKGMKQAADDFRQAFGVIEEAYNWYKSNKDHPVEAVGKSFADAVHERRQENERHPDGIIFDAPGALDRALETVVGKKALGRDEFAPAKDDADKTARIAAMQKELDAVAAKIAADKNPVSFPAREADAIARVRELRDAIGLLKGPETTPLPPSRPEMFRVPSRYNAEIRARGANDGRDHSLDSFVVGALEKPILHLSGTLKTAAAQAEQDGIHPAAFHPAGLLGPATTNDPVSMLAAGVKQGMLEAMREWAGGAGAADGSTARAGVISAAFHPGGGYGGGGGGFGGGAPGSYHGGGDGGEFKAGPGKQSMMAKEAYDFWRSKGLDHAHAIGMVVQEQAENNFSNTPGDYVNGKPTAFGPFQFHKDRAALIKAGTGIDVMNPNLSHADALRAAYYDATQGGRKGFLDRYQRESSGLDGSSDYATKYYEGPKELAKDQATRRRYAHMWDTKGFPTASGAPQPGAGGIAGRIVGDLKIGEETYRYGSGGASGSAHVPYGDFPINPDSGNPWGRAHNAMDVNGTGSIWDASLGRMRTGIEMHAASTAEMVTHGCLGFLRDQYPQLKQRVRDMIAKTGHAYLHIGPDGASIDSSPHAQAVKQAGKELQDGVHEAAAKSTIGASRRLLKWFDRGSRADDPPDMPLQTRDMRDPKFAPPGWHDPSRPDLDREKRHANRDRQGARIEGGIDAHIHVHDGQVRSARASSTGHVRDARITVRTAPQRTFTV